MPTIHLWILTHNYNTQATRWPSFRRRHFQMHFVNENVLILLKISINNIPVLVHITVWRRIRENPLSGPIYASLGLNELNKSYINYMQSNMCYGIGWQITNAATFLKTAFRSRALYITTYVTTTGTNKKPFHNINSSESANGMLKSGQNPEVLKMNANRGIWCCDDFRGII